MLEISCTGSYVVGTRKNSVNKTQGMLKVMGKTTVYILDKINKINLIRFNTCTSLSLRLYSGFVIPDLQVNSTP